MDLFLIRHGETDANASGVVQGWLDTDLNDNGYLQAQMAAEQFEEEISAIYSSDLKRAAQTAKAFRNKYSTIPYFEDTRLRERHFGDATGQHRNLYDWDIFWSSADTVSIPGAETLNDYNARVLSFINSLKELGLPRVPIVTHSGTINRFQDLTSIDHIYITHGNASVTHIVI